MPITGFACYELNATIECFYNTSIRHLNLFKVLGVTVCRFDTFLALSAFLVLLAALLASGVVLNLFRHDRGSFGGVMYGCLYRNTYAFWLAVWVGITLCDARA